MRMSVTTDGSSVLRHGTDALGEKKSLIQTGDETAICAKTRNGRMKNMSVVIKGA